MTDVLAAHQIAPTLVADGEGGDVAARHVGDQQVPAIAGEGDRTL